MVIQLFKHPIILKLIGYRIPIIYDLQHIH